MAQQCVIKQCDVTHKNQATSCSCLIHFCTVIFTL